MVQQRADSHGVQQAIGCWNAHGVIQVRRGSGMELLVGLAECCQVAPGADLSTCSHEHCVGRHIQLGLYIGANKVEDLEGHVLKSSHDGVRT